VPLYSKINVLIATHLHLNLPSEMFNYFRTTNHLSEQAEGGSHIFVDYWTLGDRYPVPEPRALKILWFIVYLFIKYQNTQIFVYD
jgi:hypothetical protein